MCRDQQQCAVLRKAMHHQAQWRWRQEHLRGAVVSGQLRSVPYYKTENIPRTAVGSKCTVKQLGVLREAAQLGTYVPA